LNFLNRTRPKARPDVTALILALALAIVPQDAADASMLKAAHQAGTTCAEAVSKGDYKTLADLTHAKGVEAAGGLEKMLERVEAAMEDMKSKGIVLGKSKVDMPKELTKDNGKIYCVLPTTLGMSIMGKTITVSAFLLGISEDQGKSWTFLDGNGGEESLRKMLPDLPKSMKFPARTQPKVDG